LAQYNEIIVTEAQNSNVPIWNLYNTMESAPNGVYSDSGNPFDMSDGALQFGVNRRNFAALNVLQRIKNVFFP
jgi:hypothetical protein